MFGRSDPAQHWSVHAEFTISHPGINDRDNLPQTNTEHGDNGVRMTYSWTSQENNNNAWSTQSNPQSGSASNRSLSSDITKSPGFQKGNLLFTSTPARKPFNLPELNQKLVAVHDSGYGSDLLSPNSLASGSLPRRTIQPYNRKCRSTCNITLSTNVQDLDKLNASTEATHTQCGRTQSLRCQTPTIRCDTKDNFYGCGDPWCHHLHYGDEFACAGRVSPVLETCEDCPSNSSTKRPSRANTFTGSCGKHSSSILSHDINRKDASVQTFEMIDKSTSPFMKLGSFDFNKNPISYEKPNDKRKKYSATRRRTEPIHQRSRSPSTFTPDSLDSLHPTRRLTRSPNIRKLKEQSTSLNKKEVASDSKSSDNSKKPRTVHIDVYCTGTEMDSDSSSSESSDNETGTASTPQTVFESEKVRITHKRAEEELPISLKKSLSANKIESQNTSVEKEEDSDLDDGVSTAYPSKMSSYSTIRDYSSSISSVPNSWTTYSMSSCTVPDDYDSVANTSWKDTFSDIESLLHSRSSITQTDSLDFVPRKLYEKNSSIDETPEKEKKDIIGTSSVSSLQPSDSFEYANSEDKLRIKRMEQMWKSKSRPKQWQSPKSERKLLIQQKKMQEYIEKRLSDKNIPKWDSKNSDSDCSDESEKGWSFVKGDDKLDTGTIRRTSKDKIEANAMKPETIMEESLTPRKQSVVTSESKAVNTDHGSLSDSSSSKSPSTIFCRQRRSLDPSLRSPFTLGPGIYTEPRFIANKFGTVLNHMKKPGHHIGPAKNPSCLCDHCQRHFENLRCRNRTRSVGDSPTRQVQNWKDFSRLIVSKNEKDKPSKTPQVYTDY